VAEFKYLKMIVAKQNCVYEEIKRRLRLNIGIVALLEYFVFLATV
jgi:hypothetical protein